MVMLCSPNNPTGSVYSRAELEALVAILKDYPEVYILSDEIYQHINYVREVVSLAEYDTIRERLILINGISKAYAMTGYRIGWMATKSPALWQAYNRLQGQSTTCACTIAQKAAEAAYLAPQDCVEQMRRAFEKRRDLIMSLVAELPDVTCTRPDGAFYVFPDMSAYYPRLAKHLGCVSVGSREMTEYLLNEGHVACVAGADFGEDRCIRLSYATDEATIREAIKRIAIALKRLG
jgi:aspartate aminotransferase